MKKFIIILSCMMTINVYAQTIDIQMLYQKAIQNYPLAKQKETLANIGELKIKSLNMNYLPQVNINGQLSYQSEVTKLPIKLPFVSIPETSKDMYKLTLDVNQLIWDGGMNSSQKKLEEINTLSEQQNLEIELYKLKERVNLFYFNCLMLQQNIELLEISQKDIQAKLLKIESAVKNGVQNESNADNLKAEIIKIEQKIIEANSGKLASILMLSELCGVEITDNSKFYLPELALNSTSFENLRPELKSFELNKNKLSITSSVLSSKLMPKIYSFGQLGYGRPGLNMLSNDFQSFYMVGAKLSWNIWNWNQTKTDRKIIELQKDLINIAKDTYQKNSKISYQRDLAEMDKFSALMLKDLEIIDLRTKIAKNSSSQFDNGYITSSDYLNDVNAATQSKINYEMHRIQLIKAKCDYLVNSGKL
ncbi:MAG: TolC family protein [Bacteroidales bacterium]